MVNLQDLVVAQATCIILGAWGIASAVMPRSRNGYLPAVLEFLGGIAALFAGTIAMFTAFTPIIPTLFAMFLCLAGGVFFVCGLVVLKKNLS